MQKDKEGKPETIKTVSGLRIGRVQKVKESSLRGRAQTARYIEGEVLSIGEFEAHRGHKVEMRIAGGVRTLYVDGKRHA